jgi:hypothetical protein
MHTEIAQLVLENYHWMFGDEIMLPEEKMNTMV